jgi:hypothetical protein
MFGQCMLQSLLARPATTANRNFRKGSAWVGVLLIIAAVAPVILGVARFKKPAAVVADVSAAIDTHLPSAAPMRSRLKRISLTQ